MFFVAFLLFWIQIVCRLELVKTKNAILILISDTRYVYSIIS